MKALVFAVTFLSYGLYHSSRKTLSGVKTSVTNDWLDNATHKALFNSEYEARTFLGTLDAAFMIAYATGLFFWGWLGDRLNPKYVIATGMVGSGVMLTLFGAFPKWFDFYNAAYYVLTYLLFGLMQACGWPSEIAIMANWFGKANRGFVMGVWASCQPLGNVFGSFFTSWILPFGYENAFFMNGLLMLIGAFVVMISIDPKPKETQYSQLHNEESGERSHAVEGEPIKILDAILLPGVLAYCLCNACLKLVNYAFFFWLPLYLTEAYHWEETTADQLSIWYDIGGIIGSVVGGYISDKLGCRAPLIVAMLICSIGSLFVYAHIGAHMIWNAFFMTVVGVTVSGPYNLIVGTISIDLGSQPILAANAQAMSTVSGLLDGTGSAGSAIGQILVPIMQNSLGWESVFYLFMLLNTLAICCIMKRCVMDLKPWLSSISSSPELSPLLNDSPHED
uniref:MFS domain-containing protein n=1 Tax=Haemonchus contortus TaxID=6289 RepID=A0A7I4YU35_HAECO